MSITIKQRAGAILPSIIRDQPFAKGLLFQSIIGSHAYGTATPESDIDIRGIYVLGAEEFYKLHGPVEKFDRQNATIDILLYDVRKFCQVALKSTNIEWLYSPIICKSNHRVPALRTIFEMYGPVYGIARASLGMADGYFYRAKGVNPVDSKHKDFYQKAVRQLLITSYYLNVCQFSFSMDKLREHSEEKLPGFSDLIGATFDKSGAPPTLDEVQALRDHVAQRIVKPSATEGALEERLNTFLAHIRGVRL